MTQLPIPPPATRNPEAPQQVERVLVQVEAKDSGDEAEYPTNFEESIPVIFVMGISGAGKSTFIKTLDGRDPENKLPETSRVKSATHKVGIYKTTLDGQEILLVDTPGFEDNEASNLSTIQKICEYVREVASNSVLTIRGAVYLHNITTARWGPGDVRTWEILKALCGEPAMANVIVATTRWPADHADEEYEESETFSLEEYWNGILGTIRLARQDVANSKGVVEMLLRAPVQIFQAQWELSKDSSTADTSAGKIAMEYGKEALEEARRERNSALEDLERAKAEVEQLQVQSLPRTTHPPPEEEQDPKKKLDTLLRTLKSSITAKKAQLEAIQSSGVSLQRESESIRAQLVREEDVLEKSKKLRDRLDSADGSKRGINSMLKALRKPIKVPKVSLTTMVTAVGGTAIAVEIGLMVFPFYGFTIIGGVLVYRGCRRVAAGMPYQIPLLGKKKEKDVELGEIENGDDDGERQNHGEESAL